MLCPKRTRYRKYQKGKKKLQKVPKSSDTLQFGRYGLKSKTNGHLHSTTIEAVRRVMTRKLKRNGQIWVRIFPDRAASQKPLATRMGKGKGAPTYWYVPIYPGQVLFEMDGIPASLAQQAAGLGASKLPFGAVFVKAD